MQQKLINLLSIFTTYILLSSSAMGATLDPIAALAATPVSATPNPRSIVIIGDYVANWAGEFLSNYYQDKPDLTINNIAHTQAGLIEQNALNAQIAVTAHQKPSTIVICIGSNDVQQINGSLPDSPEFLALYKQRALTLSQQLKTSGAQIFWLSAPPFNLAKHDEIVTKYNAIYKQLCLDNGLNFIDIWNKFTNSANNPQLRTKNMIGFTAEGLELLTKELREKISNAIPNNNQDNLGQQNTHLGPWDILDVSGNSDNLAGEDIEHPFTEISPIYLSTPPPKGRADNFSQY